MKKVLTVIVALVLASVMVIPTPATANSLDSAPQRTENGVIFVPLRQIAQDNGASVEWDCAVQKHLE